MQIASAVARAEHAEQNLRQQTELLDEMAELAAEKEATLAQVVTLRQESDARALEIDLLSSDARLSSEAAAMWEARAKAAEKLVDERARVAEEAAAAVKMAADERLRVLEDGDGACVADVDEQAVAAAAEVRAEAIAADAQLKIYAVSRESDSLKRALAAANHGVELWKAKAEAAEADLEKALAEPDAVSRRAGGGGGRLTAYGFVEGKDLRSFLVRGTPRVSRDDERDADVVHELESVGLGAPFHGRYDRVDVKPKREPKMTDEERQRAKLASFPKMRWDPEMEAKNKERLPFNPRARGVVGKPADEAELVEGA